MASHEEVEQVLLDSIKAACEGVVRNEGRQNVAGVKGYGETARNLAEALAWLKSPNQPHGGSGEG